MRGDLPPEAEVPTINIESADSARAAAYISFSSDILEAKRELPITSSAWSKPRLTSVPGVQEAEILGGRTFAMRIWLDPERMASLGVTATAVRTALAANNYLAAVGRTKGNLVTVNPDHQHRPQHGRGLSSN